MKEKTIVSTLALLGSLATYYYAKSQNKDVVPYVMVGGFAGALAGEWVANIIFEKNKNNSNKN